jgi:GTP-binding protein EngB required for normal cell division
LEAILDKLLKPEPVQQDVVGRLILWFQDKARKSIEANAPETLGPLDSDCARLVRLLNQPKSVTVCFLGHSGVGKSTLLNALAAESQQVLPAGGIGPLTAMATEVCFSARAFFRATYHPRHHLLRLVFAFEQRLKRLGAKDVGANEATKERQNELELDQETREDVLAEVQSTAEGSTDIVEDPIEGYLKQAKRIVTGDQFSSVSTEYLVDALRMACDADPVSGSTIEEADLKRIMRVREVLKVAKENRFHEVFYKNDDQSFSEELNTHTAGFLAPLISTIQVGWPSRLLESGVILVDLPGVGIAQDSYRQITKQFVRDKARAIVLVVDRAGPTQDAVELLRTSGYWDRLVGATDDPESDPSNILIAVTKVDDVATETWRNLPQANRPKKKVVYDDLVAQFQTRMRDQIRDQLLKFGSTTHDIVSEARAQARARLLDTLEIHPVSAPEYRKILLNDEDDQPFLTDEVATGILAFRESLRMLAQNDKARRDQQIDDVFRRFSGGIISAIRLCRSRIDDPGRATIETERIAEALEEVAAPKRKERLLRVGAFREFLEETIRSRIRELVLEARQVAQEEIQEYLRSLRGFHWATLRAAVRRGGTFVGSRAINLPIDIADRFQEPLAAVWSQRLLKDIRKKTSDFASDMSRIVDEICVWAEKSVSVLPG